MNNIIPLNTDYNIKQLNLSDIFYRLNYNIIDRYIIKYNNQWYGDIGGCLISLSLSKLLYIAKDNVLYNMLIDLFNCDEINTNMVKYWITSKLIAIYVVIPKRLHKHTVYHNNHHKELYDVIL